MCETAIKCPITAANALLPQGIHGAECRLGFDAQPGGCWWRCWREIKLLWALISEGKQNGRDCEGRWTHTHTQTQKLHLLLTNHTGTDIETPLHRSTTSCVEGPRVHAWVDLAAPSTFSFPQSLRGQKIGGGSLLDNRKYNSEGEEEGRVVLQCHTWDSQTWTYENKSVASEYFIFFSLQQLIRILDRMMWLSLSY